MRFLRSAFMLGICLASPLLALGASAQGGPPPAPSVTVAKPVVKDIIERDDFIGRFEAVDQVEIRARVSGYLDKVHFQDGTLVNRQKISWFGLPVARVELRAKPA